MATSVLQLCSIKTVLPPLLRLLVSHIDAEKKNLFALGTAYILTTGHLHHQYTSWTDIK